MNRPILMPLALGFALLFGYHAHGQTPHPVSQMLSNFDGAPWATVREGNGGYELRLLSEEEKAAAEKTITQYNELRRSERVVKPEQRAPVLSAYRSLPGDIRNGQWFRISRVTNASVELRNDRVQAVIPHSSILAVIQGAKGSLHGSPQSQMILARKPPTIASTASSFGGLLGSTTSVSSESGRGGNSSADTETAGNGKTEKEDSNEDVEKKTEKRVMLFYLKHADADATALTVQEIFDDVPMRIAIQERINTIVIRAEPDAIQKIIDLIEALDQEVSPAKTTQEAGELLMLKTYPIRDVEPETVLQVLQTLFAGTPDLRVSLDAKSGRIIAYGRQSDHEAIKETINELDSE